MTGLRENEVGERFFGFDVGCGGGKRGVVGGGEGPPRANGACYAPEVRDAGMALDERFVREEERHYELLLSVFKIEVFMVLPAVGQIYCEWR